MQALILAGGEGTRLRPLTETVPKPVLPLAGKPFIAYMFEWLERHGVDDIVVSCGFLAAGMRDALAGIDGSRIRFVEEPEPLGTAGAIRYAEEMLDERFLALNGDVLADLDLDALVDQHQSTGARATIALYPVEDPSGYGLVRRDPGGEVREFVEKPGPDSNGVDGDEINAGAYVLERSVLELVPPGRAVSIEREVFPRLIGEGLYGRRLEGYWLDLGTPARYLQGTRDILERRVETSVGESLDERGLRIDDGAEVDPGSGIDPPAVIGERARVAAESRVIGPAVIGPNATVERSATVDRSVLFEGCRVGAGASIRDAILASGVEVADGSALEPGAVIGEGARV
jgi:mannose-1-phosphate guanylyltransferase